LILHSQADEFVSAEEMAFNKHCVHFRVLMRTVIIMIISVIIIIIISEAKNE
jgi:hypothetical protein